MKGSILQFLIFLLLFLFLIAAFCLFAYFHWFDTGYHPGSMSTAGFLQVLPAIILRFLPLSIVVSVVISFFATLKFRINRFVSFLLILAGATAIYFFGFIGIASIAGTARKSMSQSVVFYPGRINPFGKQPIYFEKADDDKLYKTVLRDNGGLVYRDEIKRRSLEKVILSNSDPNPYYADLLTPPGFLKLLSRDLDRFNLEIKRLALKSDYYLLFFIASQILFAVSLWSLLRIPRWPLIAVILSLVLIRALFAFYSYWDAEILNKILPFVPSDMVKDNVFPLLLLVVSLVIFLLDGVISGIRRSRRGLTQ